MSGQTQPGTALQALAEKLRTDAIAIFGEGQAERDIIEWFYAALLAAAPAHAGRPGYMPIPTVEQLAEALAKVRCFHDLSAELIAPELLANLLAAPTVKESLSVAGMADSARARASAASRKCCTVMVYDWPSIVDCRAQIPKLPCA